MTGEAFGKPAVKSLRQLIGLHDDACLDCTASAELTETNPGVFTLAITHDDTCPAYRAARKDSIE